MSSKRPTRKRIVSTEPFISSHNGSLESGTLRVSREKPDSQFGHPVQGLDKRIYKGYVNKSAIKTTEGITHSNNYREGSLVMAVLKPFGLRIIRRCPMPTVNISAHYLKKSRLKERTDDKEECQRLPKQSVKKSTENHLEVTDNAALKEWLREKKVLLRREKRAQRAQKRLAREKEKEKAREKQQRNEKSALEVSRWMEKKVMEKALSRKFLKDLRLGDPTDQTISRMDNSTCEVRAQAMFSNIDDNNEDFSTDATTLPPVTNTVNCTKEGLKQLANPVFQCTNINIGDVRTAATPVPAATNKMSITSESLNELAKPILSSTNANTEDFTRATAPVPPAISALNSTAQRLNELPKPVRPNTNTNTGDCFTDATPEPPATNSFQSTNLNKMEKLALPKAELVNVNRESVNQMSEPIFASGSMADADSVAKQKAEVLNQKEEGTLLTFATMNDNREASEKLAVWSIPVWGRDNKNIVRFQKPTEQSRNKVNGKTKSAKLLIGLTVLERGKMSTSTDGANLTRVTFPARENVDTNMESSDKFPCPTPPSRGKGKVHTRYYKMANNTLSTREENITQMRDSKWIPSKAVGEKIKNLGLIGSLNEKRDQLRAS